MTGPNWQASQASEVMGETLRQGTDPDDVVDHYPSACSMCGIGLGPDASVGHSARQVFDLPKPQPLIVTEHRAHECQCAACGATTRAPFPDGVNAPVQYGVRITTFVVYLLHYQLPVAKQPPLTPINQSVIRALVPERRGRVQIREPGGSLALRTDRAL